MASAMARRYSPSLAKCSGVIRWAASSQAISSRRARMASRSRTSVAVRRATYVPLFGTRTTSPTCSNPTSASRTVAWLTLRSRARCASRNASPASKVPVKMASRSVWKTCVLSEPSLIGCSVAGTLGSLSVSILGSSVLWYRSAFFKTSPSASSPTPKLFAWRVYGLKGMKASNRRMCCQSRVTYWCVRPHVSGLVPEACRLRDVRVFVKPVRAYLTQVLDLLPVRKQAGCPPA